MASETGHCKPEEFYRWKASQIAVRVFSVNPGVLKPYAIKARRDMVVLDLCCDHPADKAMRLGLYAIKKYISPKQFRHCKYEIGEFKRFCEANPRRCITTTQQIHPIDMRKKI